MCHHAFYISPSHPLLGMDHSIPAPHKLGDLRQSRSRNSNASYTNKNSTHFRDLNLNITAALNASASSHQDSLPSAVPSLSTNPSSAPNSPAFLTCSVPTITNDHLIPDWSLFRTRESTDDPVAQLARRRPELPTSEPAISISPQPNGIFTSEDMSTLGIHFDPRFDASIRTPYSWPSVFDINDQYSQAETAAMDSFVVTSNAPIPTFSRTYTSSPPQSIFSPERRELKRQRDLARRESKARMRRDRTTSNSFNNSQNSTPDVTPRSMSSYSSTMTFSSLPAVSSPPFATSPNYMPPLVPQTTLSESPEMFAAPFSTLISNDYSLDNYIIPLSSAPESLPIYAPVHNRHHSMSSASAPEQYYHPSAMISHPQALDHQHHQITATGEPVRVVHTRPKPQCWEHGCNGRQFSTFSNLLRHQREKSGVASKPTCPNCGAEFTRTTARNGHMAHEKCKQRRNS